MDFVCMECNGQHRNALDQTEELHDDVYRMTAILYLGSGMNEGGEYEVAVTIRNRLVFVKVTECKIKIKMKCVIFKSYP